METLTAQGTLLASLAFHCWVRSSGTHGGAPISQQVLDKFEEVGFPAKQKDIQWWGRKLKRLLQENSLLSWRPVPCQLCVSWGWRIMNYHRKLVVSCLLECWHENSGFLFSFIKMLIPCSRPTVMCWRGSHGGSPPLPALKDPGGPALQTLLQVSECSRPLLG